MWDAILYEIARAAVKLATRLFYTLDFAYESAPPDGAKLFVLNHPTTLDPLLVTAQLRERLHFLSAEYTFETPVTRWFMQATGQIPIDRSHPELAMQQAQSLLASGGCVGIFIEGKLSPLQGGVRPPTTGAARLALVSKAPLVPVGVYVPPDAKRTFHLHIKGKGIKGALPRSGPYQVTVGKPIQLHGDVANRALVRQLSQQVLDEIARLSLQSRARLTSGVHA